MEFNRTPHLDQKIPGAIPSRCPPRPESGGGEAQPRPLSTDVLELDRELLLARCEVAEAFFRGGDLLALETIASSSLRLCGCVADGVLSVVDLADNLQEVASNLGVAGRDQDAVQLAISHGPRVFAEIAVAA